MTIALFVMLLGLVIWIIFSKTGAADGLMAEIGRIAFAFGLLVWLLGTAGKSLF